MEGPLRYVRTLATCIGASLRSSMSPRAAPVSPQGFRKWLTPCPQFCTPGIHPGTHFPGLAPFINTGPEDRVQGPGGNPDVGSQRPLHVWGCRAEGKVS